MIIGIAYFSGTDVTATVARSLAARFKENGHEAPLIDITPKESRENFSPDSYDALVLGFPVYSDFAPPVINDWLSRLQGGNKKCALFCTYGARTSGYFHYHTWRILSEGGFRIMMSAEFLGRHTFNVAGWKVLSHRPDEKDLCIAREMADRSGELFADPEAPLLHLQRPMGYREKLESLKGRASSKERKPNQPVRKTDTCSLCGLCEQNCPTGAFDAHRGEPDPELCIACQRCLFHCPDKVLVLQESMYRSYEGFVKDWGLTDEVMEQKKSKLVLKAWDTIQ